MSLTECIFLRDTYLKTKEIQFFAIKKYYWQGRAHAIRDEAFIVIRAYKAGLGNQVNATVYDAYEKVRSKM